MLEAIAIVIISLLVVAAIVFAKLCYIDVPQNSVLVIDNNKVVLDGAFVLPNQKKQLIKIAPVQIKTSFLGKDGLYSQDKLLMDVVISYTLCVDQTREAILSAIDMLGVDFLADANAVSNALTEKLKTAAQQVVQQYDYEVLDKDRGKLRKALIAKLTNHLNGYSLLFINIDKIELMPLQKLAKHDSKLAAIQEEIRFKWEKQQKELLANRLKLVLNQQQQLSLKIKKMIAEYQVIISNKLKFHLNRDFLK